MRFAFPGILQNFDLKYAKKYVIRPLAFCQEDNSPLRDVVGKGTARRGGQGQAAVPTVV